MYFVAYYFLLIVTPFDPEIPFDMRGLSLVEEAGIPLMSTLKDYTQQIKMLLDLQVSSSGPKVDSMDLNKLFTYWLMSGGKLPPTWINLLWIIRQLNLDYIAMKIETYL